MEKHRGGGGGRWMIAFAVLFFVEGAIAIWIHNRFMRPCMGGVLVAILVYCFVWIFRPGGVQHLPAYVLLSAVCVEMLQYFRLVEILGLKECGAAGIILGSMFDWKGITYYGAGCLILQWTEHIGPKHGNTKQEDPGDIRLRGRSWPGMGITESEEKIEHLMDVAKMYYEQDRTQSEIVVRYDISRPMVNKLLKEARGVGIMTIRIQTPGAKDSGQISLMEQAGRKSGIYEGVVVRDGPNGHTTNDAVAETAVRCLENLGEGILGIGWGHVIRDAIRHIEQRNRLAPVCQTVCPLIESGGVGLKNYHSNELVRAMAGCNGAQPQFIYSPAYVLSEQELRLMKVLDNYHEILRAWEKLDVALVNIGNFPSTPDFASEARYDGQLMKQKAVGRILNYYIGMEGRVIRSKTDYTIQIPLELLTRVKYVMGIYSANTSPKALRGTLKIGCLGHTLAPEHVVRDMLEQ